MAESTLSVSYTEIRQAVGHNLGYTRTITSWDSPQNDDVEFNIKAGLRQFYYPPQLDPDNPPHEWSFMRPVRTITLAANDFDYDMPDDFSGMIGSFTWAADAKQDKIEIIPELTLRAMKVDNDSSGIPKYAAIRTRDEAGADGQRHELLLYPKPNTAAAFSVLSYRSAILPPKLTDAAPYPLGGMAHSETILQSCLAAAEHYTTDAQGIHYARFIERLKTSIEVDRRVNRVSDTGPWMVEDEPSTLGLSYRDILRQIGAQLDYGYHHGIWNFHQRRTADFVLQIGLRTFYQSYDWSFMKLREEIHLSADQKDYDLPLTFGGVAGKMTYRSSSNLFVTLMMTSEYEIEAMRASAMTPTYSYPYIAAVRPKRVDQTQQQRFELLVYPTPTAAVQLAIPTRVITPPLSEAKNPWPLGGADHAQTILECCLAAAERQMGVADGVHALEFAKALSNSIAIDKKHHSPHNLGDFRGEEHVRYPYSDKVAQYIPG